MSSLLAFFLTLSRSTWVYSRMDLISPSSLAAFPWLRLAFIMRSLDRMRCSGVWMYVGSSEIVAGLFSSGSLASIMSRE